MLSKVTERDEEEGDLKLGLPNAGGYSVNRGVPLRSGASVHELLSTILVSEFVLQFCSQLICNRGTLYFDLSLPQNPVCIGGKQGKMNSGLLPQTPHT